MGTLAFAAAMGWCGTPYPGWFLEYLRRKKKPSPPSPPEPWKQDFLNPVIGILGGVAGGYLASTGFGAENIAAIGLAGFAGGRIGSEVRAMF